MENIFNEILGMSLDAAWLIGAVIIVRALLYKAPKYFRKILWSLVGLRLLIPFSLKSSLSLAPEMYVQTVNGASQQMVAAPGEQSFSVIGVISVVWIVVAILFLGYGSISYLKLKIKILDGVIYKENIYYSDKIESPFVCGFIKPKIYIPYGLDEQTQNCVLQHEKTHIKHGDHILKCLGFSLLCLHWFNPLVWISYFLLCKDIELSCDESVIKNYDAEGCKQYAKALLELGVNKVKLSACPVAFGEVSIKKRIVSVVNYKKAGKILIFISLCLCAAVAVCFMTEPEVKAKEPEKTEITEKTEETTEKKTEPTTELTTEPTTELTTEPTTEPTTELTTEPTIEPTTEAVTEPSTEEVIEYDETVEEATIDYDELSDSIKVQEENMLEEMQRRNEILMEEQNKNNSFEYPTVKDITPTFPVIVWDLAVTQQGQGSDYRHTRAYNPYNPNDQFYSW